MCPTEVLSARRRHSSALHLSFYVKAFSCRIILLWPHLVYPWSAFWESHAHMHWMPRIMATPCTVILTDALCSALNLTYPISLRFVCATRVTRVANIFIKVELHFCYYVQYLEPLALYLSTLCSFTALTQVFVTCVLLHFLHFNFSAFQPIFRKKYCECVDVLG